MTVLIHTAQVEVLPRETGMPGDSLGIRAELWGQLWNPSHRTQEYCTQIHRFKPWATHTQEWCLGIVISTLLLLQLLPNTLLSSLLSAKCTHRFSGLRAGTAESSWLCALQAAQGLLPTMWNPGSPVGGLPHPRHQARCSSADAGSSQLRLSSTGKGMRQCPRGYWR